MKPFSEERDELAKINVRDSDIAVMDTYSDHEERFKAGYNACLKSQVVRAMVLAIYQRRFKKCNDTCSQMLDEKLPCDCGYWAGVTALEAYEQALKSLEGEK